MFVTLGVILLFVVAGWSLSITSVQMTCGVSLDLEVMVTDVMMVVLTSP